MKENFTGIKCACFVLAFIVSLEFTAQTQTSFKTININELNNNGRLTSEQLKMILERDQARVRNINRRIRGEVTGFSLNPNLSDLNKNTICKQKTLNDFLEKVHFVK